MKREIKFRAWTKKHEMKYDVVPFQWDYVIDRTWHKCISSNGNGILGSGGTEAKFEVGGYAIAEESILMQFTGILDKNGKEIYEGDILENYNVYKFPVEWSEDREGYPCWNISNPCDYAKVIGNVYENPELLQ